MPASNLSAAKQERLARWNTLANDRTGSADPTWAMQKRTADKHVHEGMKAGVRQCSGKQTCSCRACVLTRWEATSTTVVLSRTALRVIAPSGDNDSRINISEEESMRLSSPAERKSFGSFGGFAGFGLVRAIDHFGPLRGVGPSMTVEAIDLDCGTEQTMLLGDMKMSVCERTPKSAFPETIVTVYRRRRTDSAYEKLYAVRTLSRERPKTVERLAEACEQAKRTSEHGDVNSVGSLLKSISRDYGTTVADLVDAVCGVASAQIGEALTRLSRDSMRV